MDTRGLYKQDYEAQMNGRGPDIADERTPQSTVGVDADTAPVDAPNVGPDEITTNAAHAL